MFWQGGSVQGANVWLSAASQPRFCQEVKLFGHSLRPATRCAPDKRERGPPPVSKRVPFYPSTLGVASQVVPRRQTGHLRALTARMHLWALQD